MPDFKKIVFRLKADNNEYPPVAFESLWGIARGADSYTIDNVPYYAYGVSKGDSVAVDKIDGEFFASAVVERGGHSTLRVFVDTNESRAAITQVLESFGASCSTTKGLSLFAVDIPPDADFQAIDLYLAASADDEHVAYEDACLQHDAIDQTRIQECLFLASVPQRLN
ncbi:DUF4265 domain-containing protein [Serratia liquefaciens]|uniref:DUF4265 domain-containing protein n=1 Tax=Serratia liquefaciens TaxID=614 RepID=UPI002914AC63|nr:DUF4265 domain-containing protein [Serratia liquefaciens]